MAMDLLGTAGMSNGMKQFYSRDLLERTIPLTLFLRFADRKTGIPRNQGRSLEWRRYERAVTSVSPTALTEGTPPSETQLTISNVQATVNQYGAFTRHSEVLDLQNYDPYIGSVTEQYAEHMALTLDTVVRNIIVAGTTVQYVAGKGSRGDIGATTGDRISYAEIREIVSTLRGNNVPPVEDGKFIGVMHPHTEYDLFADSDVLTSFQNAYERGRSNPIVAGEVKDFHGVRWFVTTQARIFGSLGLSGADVYSTLVFGRQAYAAVDYAAMGARVIVKPVGSAGALDPLSQMGTVGWKAAMAAAILDQNRIVRLEHTADLGDEGV